jgi:DNA-directed RNA polymerases I, II, and III subunit RPABC2
VSYRENADNLIEEDNYLEDYDQNGGMDVDDPSSADRQNQPDSTDYNNNIVESGDVEAQKAARALNTVKGVKDRKIPNDKRVSTPYMTKYERARVLGTRALQIR